MLDDIIRTLPEDLMKELNGGIHAVERDKLHKKAKNMAASQLKAAFLLACYPAYMKIDKVS